MKKLVIFAVILPAFIFAGSVVFVLAKGALFPKQTHESRLLPRYIEKRKMRDTSPRVVIPEPTHDFGVMDPLTEGQHTFVVRNIGKAPLKLTLGSTTCKCTFSKLEDSSVPPGGAGEVTLTWNTGRKDPVYSHGATIHTNDPETPSIDVHVQGYVRVQLGFEPAEIVFPRIEPDTNPVTETILYTQDWDSFQVEDVTCSMEGFEWEVQDLDSAWLDEHKAKFGCRLLVTLPANLAEGHFHHQMTVHVTKNGEADVETFEVPLKGKVLRRLSAYGPTISGEGVVQLGALEAGKGTNAKVLLKIRDEDKELRIKTLTVEPEFVKVEVNPTPGLEGRGLYMMDLAIPEDAPVGSHTGVNRGRILMEIDHPRISSLELKLDFIISPR